MKRIILCLALGLLAISVTNGCSPSSSDSSTAASTNAASTNATTNAAH